jgi:tetratricopeptide (TPR) repeat protein
MNWIAFADACPSLTADAGYTYEGAALRQHWQRLHASDAEPYPARQGVADAWTAYHAGDFHRAMKLGLAQGVDGYCVAHKATCVYASLIEEDLHAKLALFDVVAERCERQQREQPDNPAGYYWQAYALGRYAQSCSVVKALAKGMAPKVRANLARAIALAPNHADAWLALGVYHSEIVGATGPLIASVTYGARKEDCQAAFRQAIALNPFDPGAYTEWANARLRCDGKKALDEARALYRQAAAMMPADAKERLEVERAKHHLEA